MFISWLGIKSLKVLLAIWIIFFCIAGIRVFVYEDKLYEENGLLEVLQVLFLIYGFFMYFWHAFVFKKSLRLIVLMLALICYAFILREVDLEKLFVPEFFKVIGSGFGRNISVTILFFLIIFFTIKNGFFDFLISIRRYICHLQGGVLVLAFFALASGAFFEKANTVLHNVFFEEMFELFAYSLIMFSSYMVRYYEDKLQ